MGQEVTGKPSFHRHLDVRDGKTEERREEARRGCRRTLGCGPLTRFSLTMPSLAAKKARMWEMK